MARHGMTISDTEVDALVQVFSVIDRGGDPRTLMRNEHVRRFRASLSRIQRRERMKFGGRKRNDLPGESEE